MTNILIASHGRFASGLQSSLEILTGMGNRVTVIDAYIDNTDYTSQINTFIQNAQRPAVIFTDLKGGSVNQKVLLATMNQKSIYIISQMNLAIILSVLLDTEPLSADRLDFLISQSQVERITLPETSTESDDDFLN
ncbi:PTS fructose transporter subunit IIA [Latilactobacillus sakei]|jgi:PTS system mannose-specific IIA component|uniref:PTS sugar transporter subunit IIA domain-containing protein n=1 Tax=Latilactobacillus sakei TaxID=1599 RepID=UPI0020730975|nr:PTS fructose transporter subunit IIA [Latilactobacillus sakei]MDN4010786.1 PTS fructose transporter subunit IIA [Latilactobacillus sakei]USG07264.1 PTS fructose transporter subunit IIA [Latilactobacillus sakei]USG10940.1 PTS fructose transporter subunit IIA [Latilactobacillus sakei]